jgi:hypothetical protein
MRSQPALRHRQVAALTDVALPETIDRHYSDSKCSN